MGWRRVCEQRPQECSLCRRAVRVQVQAWLLLRGPGQGPGARAAYAPGAELMALSYERLTAVLFEDGRQVSTATEGLCTVRGARAHRGDPGAVSSAGKLTSEHRPCRG